MMQMMICFFSKHLKVRGETAIHPAGAGGQETVLSGQRASYDGNISVYAQPIFVNMLTRCICDAYDVD